MLIFAAAADVLDVVVGCGFGGGKNMGRTSFALFPASRPLN